MGTAVTSTIALLQTLIFKYTPSASALTHCSARTTLMTKTVLSIVSGDSSLWLIMIWNTQTIMPYRKQSRLTSRLTHLFLKVSTHSVSVSLLARLTSPSAFKLQGPRTIPSMALYFSLLMADTFTWFSLAIPRDWSEGKECWKAISKWGWTLVVAWSCRQANKSWKETCPKKMTVKLLVNIDPFTETLAGVWKITGKTVVKFVFLSGHILFLNAHVIKRELFPYYPDTIL